MPDLPSEIPEGADPRLATLLPNRLPDPEHLVYERLLAHATNVTEEGKPAINDPRPGAPPIEVVRGWPSYPGRVPALGVASGTETEDQQEDLGQAQFAGTAYAVDPDDGETIIGAADYYAEPLYTPVIVTFIHENRDERDRLHNELRRILFPLRTWLIGAERQGLIKKVRLDAEKGEVTEGPPVVDEPFVIYSSVYTVHVTYEWLEARDVQDASSFIEKINVTAELADTGS